MDLTRAAYGTWSAGRFMHFGETLSEERFIECVQTAYENNIRTFVTADAYGALKADALLAKALRGIDRSSYCLVGMLGHDIHHGERQGAKGWQRYTDPELRSEAGYADFLNMAAEKSLEAGLAHQLGIAPGPANGFTLDLIKCFEDYAEVIDWAMLILSPMEPWPTNLVLPVAEAQGIDVLTRVVDHGGVFHDDLKPGHEFKPGDHRAYRPEGHDTAIPIEEKIIDFGKLPDITLSAEDSETIRSIGDNTGCMMLKGASSRHETSERPDEWPMRDDLLAIAAKYDLGEW